MTALLTGDTSRLSDADASDLKIAGVYHVVSVSGMHVSILLGFLLFGFRGSYRRRALIGIPVAAAFAVLMGGGPGVVRAVVMYLFVLAAPLFRREADSLTSLGAALLAMLLPNPFAIANVSLQLSFAATAGIILFYPLILRGLRGVQPLRRLRAAHRIAGAAVDNLLGILATTFAALILTLPLMALWFGTISLVAPLANLLVVPAVSACFLLGLAALPLGALWPPLGLCAVYPADLLSRYILGASRLAARLPYAQVDAMSVYVTAWLLFAYGIIALWIALRPLHRRPLLPASALVLTLSLSLLLSAGEFSSDDFSVTALDVGQGQCILFTSSGASAAVDCGGTDAGETLATHLSTAGAAALDVLILTHYDEGHLGGVASLLHRTRVRTIYVPAYSEDAAAQQLLLAAAEAAGSTIITVESDQTLAFGSGTLSVFAPVTRGGDNDAGLSVLFTCGTFDALVTGDMDTAAEQRLLKLHAIPDLEILVAGHHGSKNSTGAALLAQTRPEIVLISVGENRYGHPAAETLSRIDAVGAQVCRTDQCGNITVGR